MPKGRTWAGHQLAVDDFCNQMLAPDWIREVLSPSTIALDRTRKTHHYARAGIANLWFVDPIPETLEVYRLDAGGWRLVTSAAGTVPDHVE